MSWGTSIVLAFIAFIALVITLVTVSMRQDISLVATDYYVQEIDYGQQIDRMENAQRSAVPLQINHDKRSNRLSLHFPDGGNIQGQVHFFRPSDAKRDKIYPLKPDEEKMQYFNLAPFEKGLWKVKLRWSDGRQEFYKEESLIIR